VGDDIQKDVEAMGVLWIRIHKATGLSKQDRKGSEGGGRYVLFYFFPPTYISTNSKL